MSSVKEAILRGTQVATETHDAFRIREFAEAQGRPIDVFGVLDALELPVEFAKLDGLLGACVKLSKGVVGIMVTTERDLHMQRFTAAHELGHFVLEHDGSYDREVRFPGNTRNRDLKEVEADAFAAEFLMPKWLYKAVTKRHEWWAQDRLAVPDNIYQLSLRMAVSYEATCWGLVAHKLVPELIAQQLVGVEPKECKKRALSGTRLGDPWADVWVITATDNGTAIEAGPTDLLVLDVDEAGSSGYLWDLETAESAGFEVVNDTHVLVDDERIGGLARRRVVLKVPPPGTHELRVVHTRPWSKRAAPLGTVSVSVSTFGKETEGLLTRPRHSATAAHH